MRDFSHDHSALALNTATLGHNVDGHGAGWAPERIIDACAERGFGGIVFWRREIGGRAVEIGERARAAGLEVCGLCRSPFLVGPLALPSRQAVMDDFRASIDMAAALGASCLTICVGGVIEGSHSMRESLRRVADLVAEAVPHAAQAGVSLALEPLHPVYGGNRSCLVTVRDAVDMCEAIADPVLKVAVDVYHVWWDLSLPEQLRRLGGSGIAGYHLCDWLADTRDVLLDRGMMGDGVADLRAIRRAVEDAGYAGYCEVEIFSAANWWKRDPADVLDICVERFRTHC
ncbi:sugar phosphate isomerase/epimerase family protein [Labrys monachus]|uniref:Sugar phosphate isomerase/epimerase n=1 Tax=Labrys monachus TaxID=217067 RepID=A0ABU0F8P5_9HYPH|nr:sugar phosphate isomerase/epimerase family protein [Labrys monachus]MDQ0390988.1 sugar phosphate isomerase/epimerase [Labrys monachus]